MLATFMPSLRHLLVGLGLGFATACPPPPPTPDTTPEATVPEAPTDLRQFLRLADRPFPLLAWAAYSVEAEYYDPKRLNPREQLASALTYLGLHTPEFFAEISGDHATLTVGDHKSDVSLTNLPDLLTAADRLETVLDFTQKALSLDLEATRKLEYAALNGFFAPLDPHTIVLRPEEHTDLGIKTRGQFGGIGAEIREEERRIRIMRVLPNSPAEQAGLQAGDLLLQIDQQSTVNLRGTEAQQLLRGPVGTTTTVKVRRGDKTLTITLTRQIIRVASVTPALLPDGVAYLRILTFQENTGEQVRQAIAELGEKDPLQGLIFDLRDNSGGLLTQAIAVLDAVVTSGELVIVRSVAGREAEAATPTQVLPPDVPIVVLINEDSASASEIVSGSLKYLDRGVVLGRPSFGKGTVQLVKPEAFYGRELALKLTIAEYLVAGDHAIQSTGVQPDLALYPVQLTSIPGVANYYDRERFERRREHSQVAHLPSARHDRDRVISAAPEHLLRYFASPTATTTASEPEALRDPEVRLAHTVVRELKKAAPTERRRNLAEISQALAVAEDADIVAGIGAAKIDWRGAISGHDDATLELSASILETAEIRAGSPFTLRVEIKNTGENPVDRVHAITDCPRDELDGIELLLGRLEPGQKISRDVRLQVMAWHSSFTDTLRVDVHAGEPDPDPDASSTVRFSVTGLPRPQLSFDFWVVDDPKLVAKAPPRPTSPPFPGEPAFAVIGNGDGNLQPGEQVLLAVEIKNHGPGAATDTRALVHNLSGTQALLEEGFLQLGPVAVGGTARGSFGITVSPSANPADPVRFDLVIADVQLRESVRHTLQLPVLSDSPMFLPKAALMRVGTAPLRLYSAAHGSAYQLGEIAPDTLLQSLGQAGGWAAFSAGDGRRAWAPADLLAAATGRPNPLPVLLGFQPPTIGIETPTAITSAATVAVSGTATHPQQVHDVLVTVKPPGVSQVEKKISYTANSTQQGPDAQALQFSAQVPLAPGSNQILITARNRDNIEATRELWVFRSDDGNLGTVDASYLDRDKPKPRG